MQNDDEVDEFDSEENTFSNHKFNLLNMDRRQSKNSKKKENEKDEEVYSTIKNFEKLPFTSIKIARDDLISKSEVEENYDISYDIERSYQSKGSCHDSKPMMFQDQIEFKTRRRKFQTDVRARESSASESSSAPFISPEKDKEPDNETERY